MTERYNYDGWNRIVDYGTSTTSPLNSYTWGLDLSGTLQGAGGVGGLLATRWNNTGAQFFPTYDGNGNVSEYLATNGTVAVHFEYDPFGNLTRLTGNAGNSFAYRFSTKPVDPATGLYYYGYRWFDPYTGRWPSRDPIEESGGVNLYGFVGNASPNAHDQFGLSPTNQHDHTQFLNCAYQKRVRQTEGRTCFEYRTTTQSKVPTTNGCGGAGSPYRPPGNYLFIDFSSCCNLHDVCYGTCGSDRGSCDRELRDCLSKHCDDLPWIFLGARASCEAHARVYYAFVDALGEGFWEAAQDENCKWEYCRW